VQTFFDVEQSASFYHRGFWLLGWCFLVETLDAQSKCRKFSDNSKFWQALPKLGEKADRCELWKKGTSYE